MQHSQSPSVDRPGAQASPDASAAHAPSPSARPSLEQWRAEVLQHARLGEPATRRMLTAGAHGSRLARPLVAAVGAPAFPMSAMDGFAVSTAHVRGLIAEAPAGPITVRVSADISAGHALATELPPGAAARIMTGAPVPAGLDAVIPVELTGADPTAALAPPRITLDPRIGEDAATHLAPGRHVRQIGEEIRAGAVVADAGNLVSAALVGIALSVGITEVQVAEAARVAVIMTGDELVTQLPGGGDSGEPGTSGAVLESNGPMLAAALADCGAEPSVYHVGDSPGDLVGLLRSLAPRHDLVVTTGGVGSGARDVVKAALGPGSAEAPGLDCSHFAHVRMRPGGPQGVGRFGRTPMVHLPGTPVGALVGFHLFVRPLLGAGAAPFTLPTSQVHQRAARRGAAGSVTVRPARLSVVEGRLEARECEGSRLGPFAGADAMIVTGAADTVTVIPLTAE